MVIVGGRVAGAATAMLLARRGLRVLAVDRARFPSDTLSTHQVQPPGVALLRAWGLLGPLLAAGAPMTRRARFDAGAVVLEGAYPGEDGVLSPRRTLLDALMLDAARAAGAEVWEGFAVGEVRAGGLTGRFKGGGERTVHARLVVGADGKHSTVARQFGAREYRTRPPATAAFYGYFADLGLTGGEMVDRPDRLAAAWPTNDGLSVVYLAVPRAAFAEVRERGFVASLPGDLAERVAAARPAERVRATLDLPNTFRRPYGPGWALVGDAGLVMDPITGQGIGNALRDADALAAAVADGRGLAGRGLDGYHRRRDRQRAAMYRLTTGRARFGPDRFGRVLYPAIAGDPARVSRFLGVLSGAEPPAGLLRVAGPRLLTGWRRTPRAA